jgi:protein SCO1/2
MIEPRGRLLLLFASASIASLCLALVACQGPGHGATSQASPVPEVFYPIRGMVKAVAADRRSVTLDHEEIPGLMSAMEMEFPVADPAVLAGIDAGARVEGQLRLRGRGPAITRLSRRGP